jgi:hypothetical protein
MTAMMTLRIEILALRDAPDESEAGITWGSLNSDITLAALTLARSFLGVPVNAAWNIRRLRASRRMVQCAPAGAPVQSRTVKFDGGVVNSIEERKWKFLKG